MDLSWLESLNPAQRAAVTHGDGPLLVIAGAGTGKTRTLACRVAWLIDQGVPAERILLLTFTRRAAAEMVSRATNLAGQSVARVWGGTFHSVANRLLRIHGSALGLPPEFTVMDEADSAGLMGMLLSELETAVKSDRRFPRKETLLRIYSRMVNAGDKLSEVCARHFPWCSDYMDAMRPVFEQYIVRKRTNQVLDYDDLLLYWKALCGVPELGDMLRPSGAAPPPPCRGPRSPRRPLLPGRGSPQHARFSAAFSGHPHGDPGRELPFAAADPGGLQRGDDPGRRSLHQEPAHDPRRW